MTLFKQINDARMIAGRLRESRTRGTLTLLLGELQRFQSVPSIPATDEEVYIRVKAMIKSIDDTISHRLKLGQSVEDEVAEKIVLSKYERPVKSAEETSVIVDEAILSTGATGMKNIGDVMKFLDANYADQYDRGVASNLIKNKLKGGVK